MQSALRILWALAFVAAGFGCSKDSMVGVELRLSSDVPPASVTTIEVTIGSQKRVLRLNSGSDFPKPNNEPFVISILDLPSLLAGGDRPITVLARDANDCVVAEGSIEGELRSGQVVSLDLVLSAVNPPRCPISTSGFEPDASASEDARAGHEVDADLACPQGPANLGEACGSCGGRVLCNGQCSTSTPSNYGQSCGECGGTIACTGQCSQITPEALDKPCGGCGGKVLCNGTCSIAPPTTLNESCGSCGGKILCDGTCSAATPNKFGQSCGTCGGTIQCNGACANTATSGAACGSCGGKTQCDGSCSVPDPVNLGKSCDHCGGVIRCDGTCSKADPKGWNTACGSCGGLVACDGTCTVPTPANFGLSCGSCKGQFDCKGNCSKPTPAAFGQPCGSCQGVVQCDGNCSVATPQNYDKPCDGCGGKTTCAGTCSNACGTKTCCTNVCVDTTVSAQNCGSCGNACSSLVCGNSSCVAEVVLNINITGVPRGSVRTYKEGSVTPETCSVANCASNITSGARLTLAAKPTKGSRFAGWTGDCSGIGNPCVINVTSARYVTANFVAEAANMVFITSKDLSVSEYVAKGSGLPKDAALIGADKLCAEIAADPMSAVPPGNYVAFLSNDATSAISRVKAKHGGSAPLGWVRMDGLPFINDLRTLDTLYPPLFSDKGEAKLWPRPVTATTFYGESHVGGDCGGWSNTTGYATTGIPNAGVYSWATGYATSCSDRFPVYCMQADYVTTVSPVKPTVSKRAFVTFPFKVGTGIGDADKACKAAALANSLTGNFKALLAPAGQAPGSRFQLTGVPYVRLDGVVVIDKDSELFREVPDTKAPVCVMADKSQYGSSVLFGSRSLEDSGSQLTTCSNWTSASATSTFLSLPGAAPFGITSFEQSCANDYGLICLED
jgi:hypothetical protein